jgi:hypothetical protein
MATREIAPFPIVVQLKLPEAYALVPFTSLVLKSKKRSWRNRRSCSGLSRFIRFDFLSAAWRAKQSGVLVRP